MSTEKEAILIERLVMRIVRRMAADPSLFRYPPRYLVLMRLLVRDMPNPISETRIPRDNPVTNVV